MRTKSGSILLLGIIALALLSAWLISSSQQHMLNSDFFSYWLAGKSIAISQSPYLPSSWVPLHNQFRATWVSDQTFLYPLPLAILFTPLSLLPVKLASWIWIAILELALVLSIRLILRNNLTREMPNLEIFIIFIGIILFRPVIVSVLNGQLAPLFLLAFTYMIIAIKNENWNRVGILLAISLLKPSLGLPISGIFVLYLLLNKKFKFIISYCLTALGLFISGLIIDPFWMSNYLSIGSGKILTNFGYSPTVWGLAGMLCQHDQLRTMGIGIGLSVILILLIIWQLIKFPIQNQVWCGATICITGGLLITPYLWAYDQILLVIPMLYLTCHLYNRIHRPVVLAIPLLFDFAAILLLMVAMAIKNDTWSILLTVFTCLICIFTERSLKQNGISRVV